MGKVADLDPANLLPPIFHRGVTVERYPPARVGAHIPPPRKFQDFTHGLRRLVGASIPTRQMNLYWLLPTHYVGIYDARCDRAADKIVRVQLVRFC